jgi:RHS repeat-associated protein
VPGGGNVAEPPVVYTYYPKSDTVNSGRTSTITYGTSQVGYLYNARGQLERRSTRWVDPSGGSITGLLGEVAYEYDLLTGSKIKTTTFGSDSVATGSNHFAYDYEERLQDVGYSPDGLVANSQQLARYEYNENGSLMTVKRGGAVMNGVVTNSFFTSAFDYTDKNELKSIIHTAKDGNGVPTLVGGALAASRFYYTVDPSGKRTSIANGAEWTDPNPANAPAAGAGTNYIYDLAGRLIQETMPATTTGGAAKTVKYEYDAVGNRTKRIEVGGVTTTYYYDEANVLLSRDLLMSEARTDGKNIGYQYDANGNLILEQHNNNGTFVKNVKRQFTASGKIATEQTFDDFYAPMVARKWTLYTYDAEGNRIEVARQENSFTPEPGTSNDPPTSTTITNRYLVDTSQPYAEVIQEWEQSVTVNPMLGEGEGNASPVISMRYDIGLDRLRLLRYSIQANAPPSLEGELWYLFDGLGSTRAQLNANGGVFDRYGYEDAFGKPYSLSNTGQSLNGFFLNGQQWDGSEGLYFNRARYYQPNTGRFIGQDPYAGDEYQANTLHRYLYAGNDPVNNIDPSGNETLIGIMIANFSNALNRIRESPKFKLLNNVREWVDTAQQGIDIASDLMRIGGGDLTGIADLAFDLFGALTDKKLRGVTQHLPHFNLLGSGLRATQGKWISLLPKLEAAFDRAFPSGWLRNMSDIQLPSGIQNLMAGTQLKVTGRNYRHWLDRHLKDYQDPVRWNNQNANNLPTLWPNHYNPGTVLEKLEEVLNNGTLKHSQTKVNQGGRYFHQLEGNVDGIRVRVGFDEDGVISQFHPM